MSRVTLRRWSDADRGLLELANAPDMTRHLGGPESDAEVAARHEKYLALNAEGVARMSVVLADDEPVGGIGWWDTTWDDQPVHETGWFVVPEAQGRGIARRALDLLVDDVRENARFPELLAFPSVGNAASNAVRRRAGFRDGGTAAFPFRGVTLRVNVWRLQVEPVATTHE